LTYLAAVFILGSAVAILWLAWRVVSRRHALPCPAWLSWMVDNPLSRRRTNATVARLELLPGQNVLDAGCGPGRLTIPIAQAVAPEGVVYAVDLQPEMLRRARTKATQAGVSNVQFLHAGLGDGHLPRSFFDRAVLVTVLGEIPERSSALREIYSAIRPEGFLLVSEVMGDPHYQSLRTVEALAREAGFLPSGTYGNRFAYSVKLERPRASGRR